MVHEAKRALLTKFYQEKDSDFGCRCEATNCREAGRFSMARVRTGGRWGVSWVCKELGPWADYGTVIGKGFVCTRGDSCSVN